MRASYNSNTVDFQSTDRGALPPSPLQITIAWTCDWEVSVNTELVKHDYTAAAR
jgi:hypothetical protein